MATPVLRAAAAAVPDPTRASASPRPPCPITRHRKGKTPLIGTGVMIDESARRGMGDEAIAIDVWSIACLAMAILYTVPKVARLESRGSQLGRGDIR